MGAVNLLSVPWFQPSPNLTAECHTRASASDPGQHRVSTLTQPHGWVPQFQRTYPYPASWFQPSPNLTAGCHVLPTTLSPLPSTFQPSPNLTAGCHALFRKTQYTPACCF